MLFTAFLLTLAFLVGYAIRRGSICAVEATRTLIVDRRTSRFRVFGVAAAGAGAVIIPLHWLLPGSATLSAGYPVTLQVLLAGAAFGIGARINGACALGTLAHVTGGRLDYGATIIGIAGGAAAMAYLGIASDATELLASPVETPNGVSMAFLAGLVLVLFTALYRRLPRWVRNLRDPASLRMGPYRATLVVGICGGLLYTLAGNWTYMSVLSHRAARLVDPGSGTDAWPVLLCAATVVAGGASAAWRNGNFDLRRPRFVGSLRCLSGGTIMGGSAAMIPGGNGTLLVHGLPSLAPHAIAAYIAMTLLLCLSFLVHRS